MGINKYVPCRLELKVNEKENKLYLEYIKDGFTSIFTCFKKNSPNKYLSLYECHLTHSLKIDGTIGANKNIIDHRVYQHFKDKLEVQPEPSEVFTLNGVSSTVTIDIPFTFENHDYHEPFLCTEMIDAFDRINDESGIQIHGILGNQFFLKYGWILDFEKVIVTINNPTSV